MYDTILVPTDASDSAQIAGTYATYIAQTVDATVHVLSVVDPQRFSINSVGNISALADRQEQALTEQAQAATERIGTDATLSVERHVRQGTPHEVIETVTAEQDVDLVAMGTHGRTGLQRYLLGSVAERTVRTLDVPVLMTHAASSLDEAFTDVLVPTDGSDYADAAVAHAATLTNACNATLHLLHVGTQRSGRKILTTTADQVADTTGQRPTTTVVDGHPHKAIAAFAADQQMDLIVMGTHGRTGLQRQLLGSVTERTLRTTDVPLLAVHLPARRESDTT